LYIDGVTVFSIYLNYESPKTCTVYFRFHPHYQSILLAHNAREIPVLSDCLIIVTQRKTSHSCLQHNVQTLDSCRRNRWSAQL